MKLYVCSDSENMIDNIDGFYYLITEEGECLASHLCSNKVFRISKIHFILQKKQTI